MNCISSSASSLITRHMWISFQVTCFFSPLSTCFSPLLEQHSGLCHVRTCLGTHCAWLLWESRAVIQPLIPDWWLEVVSQPYSGKRALSNVSCCFLARNSPLNVESMQHSVQCDTKHSGLYPWWWTDHQLSFLFCTPELPALHGTQGCGNYSITVTWSEVLTLQCVFLPYVDNSWNSPFFFGNRG